MQGYHICTAHGGLIAMTAFRFGHAQAADWQGAVAACLDQIGQVPLTGNLGFLYVTDDLADDLGQILDRLRAATRVPHWVGACGIGICATGVEYYQGSALAVMVGEFPAGAFRVFSGLTEDLAPLEAEHGAWMSAAARISALSTLTRPALTPRTSSAKSPPAPAPAFWWAVWPAPAARLPCAPTGLFGTVSVGCCSRNRSGSSPV
jgi:hypothetical protein